MMDMEAQFEENCQLIKNNFLAYFPTAKECEAYWVAAWSVGDVEFHLKRQQHRFSTQLLAIEPLIFVQSNKGRRRYSRTWTWKNVAQLNKIFAVIQRLQADIDAYALEEEKRWDEIAERERQQKEALAGIHVPSGMAIHLYQDGWRVTFDKRGCGLEYVKKIAALLLGNNILDAPMKPCQYSPINSTESLGHLRKGSSLPWDSSSRLWSLWEMIEYPVRDLCLWLTDLTRLTREVGQLSITWSRTRTSALPANVNWWPLVARIKATIQSLEELLIQCDLKASLDRIKRARFSLQNDQEIQSLHNQMMTLEETISDELTRRMFMFVPTNKAEFYTSPENRFPKSWKEFPSAQQDIIDACRCYAMGQNTASVFHCMGILQHGLFVLAHKLEVNFATSIELENWKNIIDKIEKKIRDIEQEKKSKEKDEKMKFYSELALQFHFFKDAWRNHVAHLREQYDEHRALSILLHVGDFMEHLSEQIMESPAPNGTP